jgi:type IV pilus assembly protein PilN
MAHINLLPWREERRKEQQREFGVMVAGGVVISALLVGLAHMTVQDWTDQQAGRNKQLQDEIAQVEKKIKEIEDIDRQREDLVQRMKVIQDLQESRPKIVHLVDELLDVLPVGSYLTSLKQENDKVTLDGKAQSNARVSAIMRAIENDKVTPWIDKPDLKVIVDKDRNQSGLFVFTMGLQQTSPHKDEAENSK